MANHNVHINLPWRELGKADVKFKIFQNGVVFGTLTISKGAMTWATKNGKKPKKFGWRKLDTILRNDE